MTMTTERTNIPAVTPATFAARRKAVPAVLSVPATPVKTTETATTNSTDDKSGAMVVPFPGATDKPRVPALAPGDELGKILRLECAREVSEMPRMQLLKLRERYLKYYPELPAEVTALLAYRDGVTRAVPEDTMKQGIVLAMVFLRRPAREARLAAEAEQARLEAEAEAERIRALLEARPGISVTDVLEPLSNLGKVRRPESVSIIDPVRLARSKELEANRSAFMASVNRAYERNLLKEALSGGSLGVWRLITVTFTSVKPEVMDQLEQALTIAEQRLNAARQARAAQRRNESGSKSAGKAGNTAEAAKTATDAAQDAATAAQQLKAANNGPTKAERRAEKLRQLRSLMNHPKYTELVPLEIREDLEGKSSEYISNSRLNKAINVLKRILSR